jgi:hypothetical protein
MSFLRSAAGIILLSVLAIATVGVVVLTRPNAKAVAPTSAPAASTGNPTSCTVGNLSLSSYDRSFAGAGTTYHLYVLTNTSPTSCSLTGYPTMTAQLPANASLSASDKSAVQSNYAPSHNISAKSGVVVLQAGESASFYTVFHSALCTGIPTSTDTTTVTQSITMDGLGGSFEQRLNVLAQPPSCPNALEIAPVVAGIMIPGSDGTLAPPEQPLGSQHTTWSGAASTTTG